MDKPLYLPLDEQDEALTDAVTSRIIEQLDRQHPRVAINALLRALHCISEAVPLSREGRAVVIEGVEYYVMDRSMRN